MGAKSLNYLLCYVLGESQEELLQLLIQMKVKKLSNLPMITC